jgi:hypothetical protein
MWREGINKVSEIFREKSEISKAKGLIMGSDWSFIVGFREETTEVGDVLGIRGFKGEPNLMMCDLLRKNINRYSLVRVTAFSDEKVLGVIDVHRRVIS